MEEGGLEAHWFKSAHGDLSGGLCRRFNCLCLEGSIHHACLIESLGRLNDRVPSSGLASQTSRCTKKSQRPLSPFSGQSTGRWGCRALPTTGGSDEAGAFSLLVPSLPLLLFMPSLEKTECWKFFFKLCVWRVVGVGGGRGAPGGRGAARPGAGSGLVAGAGALVRRQKLGATAALCVGGGSSTAGFQTITLNICKQIKKQNHPAQMETSAFLSLLALCPLHLSSRVLEEAGEGGLPAPPLPPATHSRGH